MNQIAEDRSLDVYWSELFYLKARLNSHPKTVGLVPVVERNLASFEDITRADRDVQGEILMSRALGAAMEETIKAEIVDLYLLAIAEVKKDKKDERYVKLIKVSESAFLRLRFEGQKAEAMRMKSVLKQTIYEDAFRDKMNAILDRIVSGTETMLAVTLAAEEKRAQHRVDVNAWKEEANGIRLDVYVELIKIGGNKAKAWARSFFPKTSSGKKLSDLEVAELDLKREEKKAKKIAEAAEYQKLKKEAAEDKRRLEKEKKELEERLRAEAKRRADENEKERAEAKQREQEQAEREAEEAKKREEERLRQLQQSEESAPM